MAEQARQPYFRRVGKAFVYNHPAKEGEEGIPVYIESGVSPSSMAGEEGRQKLLIKFTVQKVQDLDQVVSGLDKELLGGEILVSDQVVNYLRESGLVLSISSPESSD